MAAINHGQLRDVSSSTQNRANTFTHVAQAEINQRQGRRGNRAGDHRLRVQTTPSIGVKHRGTAAFNGSQLGGFLIQSEAIWSGLPTGPVQGVGAKQEPSKRVKI